MQPSAPARWKFGTTAPVHGDKSDRAQFLPFFASIVYRDNLSNIRTTSDTPASRTISQPWRHADWRVDARTEVRLAIDLNWNSVHINCPKLTHIDSVVRASS